MTEWSRRHRPQRAARDGVAGGDLEPVVGGGQEDAARGDGAGALPTVADACRCSSTSSTQEDHPHVEI